MATKALNYTTAEINQRLNLAGTAVQPNALNDYYIKTEVDGKVVVDLSTRYATSYANLSAALTALNSDTATDAVAIKKGGVSIKFINSSTNKYEQWSLKASSWSINTTDWALDVDSSNIPVDKIERENIQSEEQAIIYETDGGTQVGKIDHTGADFINLKRGGQQVARMSDLPTVPALDTSIGSSPSNNHTPSTKAVKDYVDANSTVNLPIEQEETQDSSEEVLIQNDAETETFMRAGSYGIKTRNLLDMQGNSLLDSVNSKVCYLLKDFPIKTISNCAKSENEGQIVLAKESGTAWNIQLKNSVALAVDDFVFVRMVIKSTQNEYINVGVPILAKDHAGNNNGFQSDIYYLEQNKETEIYFRGFNLMNSGTMIVQVGQAAAYNETTSNITIQSVICCVNHYEAWTTKTEKESLKGFNDGVTTFVVDKYGRGHFHSVHNACEFIRKAYDVENKQYTVMVNNGVYDHEYPDGVAVDRIINAANANISIIGESKGNTIIRHTYNSSANVGPLVDFGNRPHTIANLNLEVLRGTNFVRSSKNPYCIHIDLTNYTSTEQFRTCIKNCRCYSEVHSPIGCGLVGNEIIRVEDCDFISNGSISAGACYIHAHASGSRQDYDTNIDSTMGVEIINNRLTSIDDTPAIFLGDVGNSSYSRIPVLVQCNQCYSDANNKVQWANKNKVVYSGGNNLEELN